MTKRPTKSQVRRTRDILGELPASGAVDERFPVRSDQEPKPKRGPKLEAQTGSQDAYIASLRAKTLTFGLGAAGTGKTYCAVSVACELLERKEIERIIVTRPAVEAGEETGFLPGEIGDKFSPYFAPVREVFIERLGISYLTYCLRKEKIIALPLAFMRGWSFNKSFVILDEAQNATPTQMKMLLTRTGMGTRVAVNGDETQSDIVGMSGLTDAFRRMGLHPAVGHVHFKRQDVVRSGFVADVLEAYEHK